MRRGSQVIYVGDNDANDGAFTKQFGKRVILQEDWIDKTEAVGGRDCGGKKVRFDPGIIGLPNSETRGDYDEFGCNCHGVSIVAERGE